MSVEKDLQAQYLHEMFSSYLPHIHEAYENRERYKFTRSCVVPYKKVHIKFYNNINKSCLKGVQFFVFISRNQICHRLEELPFEKASFYNEPFQIDEFTVIFKQPVPSIPYQFIAFVLTSDYEQAKVRSFSGSYIWLKRDEIEAGAEGILLQSVSQKLKNILSNSENKSEIGLYNIEE